MGIGKNTERSFRNFKMPNNMLKERSVLLADHHPGTLTKIRPNREVVFYDPGSNTFAVTTSNGTPKTMFRPDPAQHGFPSNLDYYNAQ